jgi:hypothetical protein
MLHRLRAESAAVPTSVRGRRQQRVSATSTVAPADAFALLITGTANAGTAACTLGKNGLKNFLDMRAAPAAFDPGQVFRDVQTGATGTCGRKTTSSRSPLAGRTISTIFSLSAISVIQPNAAESKMPSADPLTPVVPPQRMHPLFKTLLTAPGWESARIMIMEVAREFDDPDGNFVEQFQTSGFDARIWELFLSAWLNECHADVSRVHPRPDFQVELRSFRFFVEAATINPSPKFPPPVNSILGAEADMRDSQIGTYAIRIGGVLFSKLQKNYTTLPHVTGHPLIIAIEDFSDEKSLYRGSASLWQYLYGIRGFWYYDHTGKLVISEVPIVEHIRGSKRIPSGFFYQPGAESISAVLFGNTGTLPKFNRMGYLKGYGRNTGVRMFRVGTCHDPDPDAAEPAVFQFEVGDPQAPVETWGEGLELFHNPRAINPMPHDLLPVAYHFVENGGVQHFLPDFHPYGSRTVITIPK